MADSSRIMFELLPTEIIQRITTFACTDGGPTGCSLALASRRVAAASASSRFHSAYVTSAEHAKQLHDLVTRSSPEVTRVRHLFVDQPLTSVDYSERSTDFIAVLKALTFAVSSTLETLVWTPNAQLDCVVLRNLLTTSMPALCTLTLRLKGCRLSNRQALELERAPQPHAPRMPRLTRATILAPIDDISKLAGILFDEAPLLRHVTVLELPGWSAIATYPVMTGLSPESVYAAKPWASTPLLHVARTLADRFERCRFLLPEGGHQRIVMEVVGSGSFLDEGSDVSVACADLGLTHRLQERLPHEWKNEWMTEVDLLTLDQLVS